MPNPLKEYKRWQQKLAQARKAGDLVMERLAKGWVEKLGERIHDPFNQTKKIFKKEK